jgi:CelD/BcsL family acetyltransferase involved in cellulose biosynthesis
MPQATVIENTGELDSLQLIWKRLWQQTRDVSFFQSLDWLRLYWQHFGAGQRLRVVLVEQAGEVLGIVPLVVRTESTRLGPVRVLTYPLHDWGSYFGPIGSNPTVTLAACFRLIGAMPRDWDILDLRWVNRDEVDRERTPVSLATAGFPTRTSVWRTTAFIDFAGDWQRYLATRSSKFRNNLRRAESSAAKAGEVTFERYRPRAVCDGGDESRWELFEECLTLAEQSWQAQSETGTTISHPDVREFFRDLFGVAGQCGALDVNLLRLNGRLAAFSYNVHANGMLSGLRLGYDPSIAAISPGRLLLARSVEDSFQRQDVRLDLGSETMSFKNAWLTRSLDSHRYTHYPLGSWRSQGLRLKHCLWPRNGESAKVGS